MTRLKKQEQDFQWSSVVDTTFQSLMEALCTTPIFGYLEPEEKKFMVDKM
jgi:hypothetical protein